MVSEMNTFTQLSSLDMTDKHKKKNGMLYLPWSSAWTAVKACDPLATVNPVKTDDGCLYHTDGRTCWVETTMTINGETQNETLAVMDHKNQAIPLENVTSVSVNKSLKRCMVKNAALFGLDLNLWEGEELSDEVKRQRKAQEEEEEAIAAELNELIAAVRTKGSELIAATKCKPAEVRNLVAQFNDGDGEPGNIPSAEVANAVIAAFEEKIAAAKKPAEKKSTKKEKENA